MKKIEIHSLFGQVWEIPTFSFMRGRYIAIAMSAFISTSSIILFFTPGLNYGIDFVGGIQVEATSKTPINLAPLREKMDSAGVRAPTPCSPASEPCWKTTPN